jgi:DnaD/phage-associated family protein
MTFPGFPDNHSTQIRIPEQFFRQVMNEIDDIDELKFTLYIFWRLDRMEGPAHYITVNELMKDSRLVQSIGSDPAAARKVFESTLQKAVRRGKLLQVDLTDKNGSDKIICLNSPKGRAIVDAVQRGEWKVTDRANEPIDIYSEHPNIFQLYEANIGPLTPILADALRDAEKSYPADWIEDAFRIAVERNKRNWHYIEAILHRWQEGGRDDQKGKQDRRDTEEARRRYGEWEN